MRGVWETDAQEAAVPETQARSREERKGDVERSLRGVRQGLYRRGETPETHDKGASTGETVSVRSVRKVLQDRGVPEDPSEAAQQTFHLRHMRYLEGLRIRSASTQEKT